MINIGMIGSDLIHTFGYAMHFNRANLNAVDQHEALPLWQAKLIKDNPDVQLIADAKLTHIAGEPADVKAAMADVFDMEVALSTDEVIEACDLIMVMDENVDSRTALAEQSLNAGRTTFIDKIPDRAGDLVDLAKQKGVRLGAWSQVGHHTEFDAIRNMPTGGTAFLTYQFSQDITSIYAIHLICAMQAALPGRVTTFQQLVKGDQQIVMIENDQGTRAVLAVGEHYVPGIAHVDYSMGEQYLIADGRDRCGAFSRSAQDVVNLKLNHDCRFTEQHIIEAAKLIDLFSKDVVDRGSIDLQTYG